MPNVTCVFFYLLVITGYLADTSGYLVVTSGYLIATTGYFSLLLVPRFSNNKWKLFQENSPSAPWQSINSIKFIK